MRTMLASALILGAAAVVALVLTLGRPISENEALRHDAARSLALAVAVQAVHFAEETATGFHQRFPELLGLSAMPLAVWAASVPALRSGRTAAFFPAWFLAIAGMLNGIGHPSFAVASGGYFPGLVTSPFIGVAGAFLWVRLRKATHAEARA